MELIPAIRHKGELFYGDGKDSHATIISRFGLKGVVDSEHGFTPDRKLFLTRKQALGWLRAHENGTFKKLPLRAAEGLHSETLADARGIERRKLAEAPLEKIGDGAKKEVLDLSEKTAIVYDRGGLYLYCAEKLSEKFGRVMYYLAEADAYPTSQKQSIGAGLPNVERIDDFWKHVDEADIICFFDCYDGEMQHWLRGKGYTVFGSGRSEKYEIDKVLFLETLEKLGLPCPKTYLAEGMKEIRVRRRLFYYFISIFRIDAI